MINSRTIKASLSHAWDVRYKLFSMLILTITGLLLKTAVNLTFFLLFSFTLAIISRISLSSLLKSLKFPLIMLAIMCPMLILSAGGTYTQFFFVKIYSAGISLSIIISLKAFSIMILFIILFKTTPLYKIMQSFESFKIPKKLVTIFLLTYRFIFVFSEQKEKLFKAAIIRGMKHQGLFGRINTKLNIIMTLFIQSHVHCERIYFAMINRGFKGTFTHFKEFNSSIADIIKTCLIFIFCILLIILEIQ